MGTPSVYYDGKAVGLEWHRCVILAIVTGCDFSTQGLTNTKKECTASYLVVTYLI